MLQEALDHVINNYSIASTESFSDHSLADFIRHELPSRFGEATANFTDINWQGSPGQGQWSHAPWLAAFNRLVTTTARRGYYPAYLFSRDMSAVYLSFNQGVTLLQEEFGSTQARDILTNRARIVRARLSGHYEGTFSNDPIHLDALSPSSLLGMYESGHIFGIQYRRGQIPSTSVLVEHIYQMLLLYRRCFILGGISEFDTDISLDGAGELDLESVSLQERKRYRTHRTVERNPRLANLAKEYHGYTCQVCGFNFEEVYGELGHEYIEAHHLTPLSQISDDEAIQLSPAYDFAVVCANCHRMIHRKGAPESFQEFVEYYQSRFL